MRRSSRWPRLIVALFSCGAALLLLTPGLTVRRGSAARVVARAQTGKSIEQFIRDAYAGVGITPSCIAVRNENAVLEGLLPTTSAAFEQEARHFVSTLIETQASYDDATQENYCQTASYEARYPAYCNPFINTDSEAFVTDLYHAFLQREPDSGGLAYWTTEIPSQGRRRVLDAFGFIPDDAEFTNLVHSLVDTGPVCCPVRCPRGYYYDCDLDSCTAL
jgi:hypothetical protein